jgi:hypothetical protein
MAYWHAMGSALGSTPMSAFYGYRAELANQVIVRLKRLSDPQWLHATSVLEERRQYFDLAYALSAHAIDVMAEEEGEEGRALLQAHLSDIDAALAGNSAPDAALRCLIGRAAVMAVFLRDTRGFNHGAFVELFAPASECLSLADLAATASAALARAADDFNSTVRAQPAAREAGRKRA